MASKSCKIIIFTYNFKFYLFTNVGPASFILEPAEDDDGSKSCDPGSKDVLENLLLQNLNFTKFDQPVDVSMTLDDLRAHFDLSEIIEIDFSKANGSWTDVTMTSMDDASDGVSEDRTFSCDSCQKTFTLASKLKRHRLKFHAGKRKGVGKGDVENRASLKNATNSNPADGGRSARCHLCRKVFSSKETKERHMVSFYYGPFLNPELFLDLYFPFSWHIVRFLLINFKMANYDGKQERKK